MRSLGCASEMLVRLKKGKCTPCSERVEREGHLEVNFKGRFVPLEQGEPFEEEKGIGKMNQHLSHFLSVSTGEMMFAVTGHKWRGEFAVGGLPVGTPPPKVRPPIDAEL